MPSPNYDRLATNIRLALNRLKVLEKKKHELAKKYGEEIADYIRVNKTERAKIRVEHIIREDFLVEAMELVEMYCDLLLTRMSLFHQEAEVHAGLAEAISSVIWVTPHLRADVPELEWISHEFTLKYNCEYVKACRSNAFGNVSSELMRKLSAEAPPKLLVERYIIEIARNYDVQYDPDHRVLSAMPVTDENLIDFDDVNGNRGRGPYQGGSGSGGSIAKSAMKKLNNGSVPSNSTPKSQADENRTADEDFVGASGADCGKPSETEQGAAEANVASKNQPPAKAQRNVPDDVSDLDLPDVPTMAPTLPSSSDVKFDDLFKRFEKLRKGIK